MWMQVSNMVATHSLYKRGVCVFEMLPEKTRGLDFPLKREWLVK